MASFPNTAILSCVFLLITFWMSRRACAATNILLSGQTLGPNEKLSYETNDVRLVMQLNCNLELKTSFWSRVWYSDSSCLTCFPCSLTLTNRGQLVIHDRNGNLQWTSPPISSSKVGKYVAVLHPVDEFAVYGPGIWSVQPEIESVNFNNTEKESLKNNLKDHPTVYNVLFPNQELYDGDKLSNNGYEFIFKDCELILKANGVTGWYSNTHLDGANCFATVDYKGELAIRDGDHKLIWSNDASGKKGKYVLVMQENGSVVIYGPKVWSTRDSKSGYIKMATVEK